MLRTWKGLVFDLDGTLVDSAATIGRVLNEMRTQRGLSELPVECYRGWVSRGVAELIRNALETRTLSEAEELVAVFREAYRAAETPRDSIYSWVREGLGILRAEGARMAVCSNKPEALCVKVLDEVGLLENFESIVGGDTVGRPKPDPAPLHHAVTALKVPADTVVLIGDSSVDQQTADAAGVAFLFFRDGYDDGVERERTAGQFRNFGELKHLLSGGVLPSGVLAADKL